MIRPGKYSPVLFYTVVAVLVLGFILSRVFSGSIPTAPEISISSSDAMQHIGVYAEVCGPVANTSFREDIDGSPTFLNFDHPYPNQLFTVLIWGENRNSWQQAPELLYRDQSVCVIGTIKLFEDDPEIIAESPDQITIQSSL